MKTLNTISEDIKEVRKLMNKELLKLKLCSIDKDPLKYLSYKNILKRIGGNEMRYTYQKEDGMTEYYLDVVSASKLIGVSRRTLDEYLKKVPHSKDDKRRIGLKMFISETLLSKLWVLSRRNENYSPYPNNRGSKSIERRKEIGLEVKNTGYFKNGVWVPPTDEDREKK